MADRALIDAARVFDRDDWEATAVARLRRQLAGTFDDCGLVYEQSSSYQVLQARLWESIASRLEGRPWAGTAESASRKAMGAAHQLARPDGVLEIIGDGTATTLPHVGPVSDSRMWCPESGWAIKTLQRGETVQHSVIRFGPRTKIHGHADKGSITWWVGDSRRVGKPVLVDRGLYSKKKDKRLTYARGSAAHTTLTWAGGSDLSLDGRVGETDTFVKTVLSGQTRYGEWTRRIIESKVAPTVTVTDMVSGGAAASGATQVFPLAPEWIPAGRGIYSTSDGWQLSVTCSASSGSVKMTDRVVEHFPDMNVREKAHTVACVASGARDALTMKAQLSVRKP